MNHRPAIACAAKHTLLFQHRTERRPGLSLGIAIVLGFVAAGCGSDATSSPTVANVITSEAVNSQTETTTSAPAETASPAETTASTQAETTTLAPALVDGTFAFGKSLAGQAADIYVSAADGTAETRLTTDAGFDACANFTPDGSGIAFCSNRSVKSL